MNFIDYYSGFDGWTILIRFDEEKKAKELCEFFNELCKNEISNCDIATMQNVDSTNVTRLVCVNSNTKKCKIGDEDKEFVWSGNAGYWANVYDSMLLILKRGGGHQYFYIEEKGKEKVTIKISLMEE